MTTVSNQDNYYMGFWYRFGAGLFDLLIFSLFMTIVLALSFGFGFFADAASGSLKVCIFLLYGLYLISFWSRKSATLGNWLVSQRVCDFKTGQPPNMRQCVIRWLSLPLSLLPLGLGLLWVAWDKNKRAWHDYLAGTAVISDSSYVASEHDKPFVASVVT